MRYFVGLPIPSNGLKQLKYKSDPRDLHVTLIYLGKKSPEEIHNLKHKLHLISKGSKEVPISGKNYARFGDRYPHFAVNKNYELMSLYNKLHKFDNGNDVRTFVPHITIGTNVKRLPEPNKAKFVGNSMSLFKIENNIKGNENRLQPIAVYPLQKRTLLDKGLDLFRNLFI